MVIENQRLFIPSEMEIGKLPIVRLYAVPTLLNVIAHILLYKSLTKGRTGTSGVDRDHHAKALVLGSSPERGFP